MRFITHTLAAIAVVLGVALCAPTANADPLSKPASPEARSHLALGNRLYGVRSFDEAVAQYKAGAIIEPAPVFDYNLGQCFRQLGKYQEAIWHYERFLSRSDPQGELLDAVNGFIAQMKSELDKKAMTQKPTEPGPTATTSRVAESTPAILRTQPQAGQVPEAWYNDGFGWGLAGAGVVFGAVAGGLLIDAASLTGDANASPSQQERGRLRDKASSRNMLGAIIGIGGAGLLVTGIVKLALYRNAPPSHAASLGIAATAGGVLVFGRF
jgi:tetratricopeptide (TPR) repeat protein